MMVMVDEAPGRIPLLLISRPPLVVVKDNDHDQMEQEGRGREWEEQG
jgi:hypothetical protein